jgi:molybdate transport system substrate-binding protein
MTTAAMKLLCTNGLRTVMNEVAPAFERVTGTKLDIGFGSTNKVLDRLRAGEICDLVILSAEAIDGLIAEGKVVAGSHTDLARSAIGVAMRNGATAPDISTVAVLKDALLGARAVAYSKTGVSGIYMAALLKQLGIADTVVPKAVIPDTGTVGEAVARGEAELAVQQISELMEVPGITVVGPLPAAVQKITVMSAGIFRGAANPKAARTLVEMLTSSAVRPLYAKKGLEAA